MTQKPETLTTEKLIPTKVKKNKHTHIPMKHKSKIPTTRLDRDPSASRIKSQNNYQPKQRPEIKKSLLYKMNGY